MTKLVEKLTPLFTVAIALLGIILVVLNAPGAQIALMWASLMGIVMAISAHNHAELKHDHREVIGNLLETLEDFDQSAKNQNELLKIAAERVRLLEEENAILKGQVSDAVLPIMQARKLQKRGK